MAEDGLFLNFAIPETFVPATSSASKFKGGSWRERLRLKKSAKSRDLGETNRRTADTPDAAYIRAIRKSGNTEQNAQVDNHPAKRLRRDGDFRPSEKSYSAVQGVTSNAAPKRKDGREVISSLFSFNPAPTKVDDNSIAESPLQPTKPSNAPLPDGIDTFTTLGLSTTLAAHLLTKMGLSNPTAIQRAALVHLLNEDSDAFIQSETGSGKTLAYLLPIVQRIMSMTEQMKAASNLGEGSVFHRDSGLFAIILAPTRELCKQISVVLEKLLGCAHFIVAGTVIGGEKKKSEKARLRKGLNILVATPGRMVDHLENTKSLDVSHVRYLVLDEGDRLMDLGFEEDITKIVKALDGKMRKNTGSNLPDRRITMLCSATLKMNVQKLGDISLKDAVLVKGEGDNIQQSGVTTDQSSSAFLAPAQLKQSYIVTAAKLRLVTLIALLKRTFARKGSVMKAIVFVSCADSVEFHFKTFSRLEGKANTSGEHADSGEDSEPKPPIISESLSDAISSAPSLSSPQNPLTVYKLHGSLPQAIRTAIFKSFATSTQASVLIATDVASRGLDLPNLDLVIEYDPAFSTDDHLHRIGRTARLGRDGRAIIFLLPGKEENYIEILRQSFKKDIDSTGSTFSNVTSQTADDILQKGFTQSTGVITNKKEWESKATDFQLDVERWVLSDPKIKESARKAFTSHIRAYATHVVNERQYFDIKDLHLGHLAKAFGLRDPPGRVNVAGTRATQRSSSSSSRSNKNNMTNGGQSRNNNGNNNNNNDATSRNLTVNGNDKEELIKAKKRDHSNIIDDTGRDTDDAARRMREVVRNRKKMMGAGADEFNLA